MFDFTFRSYIPGTWLLDEVECSAEPIDGRIFTYGRPLGPLGPLSIKVHTEGEPLDITFALHMVPIVTRQVADVFERFAPGAIQCFPVQVGDIREGYEVLNVVRMVDAVDRERSTYRLWKPEDERPDKLGGFRGFDHMVLKKDLPSDAHAFRLQGWKVVVIVSPQLKEALEEIGARGATFVPIEQ